MDKNKLEKILLENIKIIYATFLKKGVFEEDAKDLTQDCFLAILKSSDKILNENAIFGYIYSTVNNRYKKYLTTKKMNSYIPLDDNYPSNNEVGYESENYNKLRRELALLSKEYRECTVLYYFNDYTINGIANKLNLSSEMVKYYLFKTRKILKEGINMERIFGKKSYEPEELGFTCIFNGNCDSNFENLFNRKIVGNIILSAYYTPMSLLELSVELGVASVYLEDEIDLLLKYKVLKKVGKKYQANVVVLTKEYFQSFIKKSSIIIKESLAKVFDLVQNNIFDLKKNNLITGNNLENYIKWSLLPLLLSLGFEKTKND